MTDPRQSRSEIVQGCIVLLVMLGGLGWLVDAALHSTSFWFKAATAIFCGSVSLWGGIIAWLATCQWLDKRRFAREGRPWPP